VEYNNYVGTLKQDDPDRKLDKQAVIDSIKVQKYLYEVVYKGIEVSNKEIRDYYNQNIDNYRKKGQVLLHQILVNDKELAFKIRGELKNAPGRFAEFARQYSISMEKDKGGEMGYFEEGTLPKDMEKVVFSLDTNTISPVVDSTYGYHIFKVTKKKGARLLFLAAVENEIKNQLMSDKLKDAYDQFLKQAGEQLRVVPHHDNLYVKYHPIQGDTEQQDEGDANYETSDYTDNNPGPADH
jgi:parvulin-like peptidyl-prolyl isomerase